jgi:hypothetical protein
MSTALFRCFSVAVLSIPFFGAISRFAVEPEEIGIPTRHVCAHLVKTILTPFCLRSRNRRPQELKIESLR